MKWETVKLIDVCDFQGGTQPPKSSWSTEHKPGYVRMLQIRDFTQGKESFIEYVKDIKTLKKCNQEDILIGRYGASIGKILTGLSGAYNVALVKTVPTKRISRRYLYFYLLSDTFQNFIQNAGSRAAQAGFNKEELGTLNISLPPIDIQEQIANTLDKADALSRKDQELLTKYDELAKVIFYDMFGETNTNPKKIDSDILKNVCSFKGGKAWKNSELSSEGFPIIRISNLHKPNFKLWRTESTVDEKYLIKNGDLLFSWAGVQSSIDVYIYEDCDAMLNQHIYNLIPKNPQISRKFIYFNILLQLNKLRSNLGGGVGHFHMKKKDIEDIRILLPTLLEQEKFEKRLNLLQKQIHVLNQNIHNTLCLINTISDKAFS